MNIDKVLLAASIASVLGVKLGYFVAKRQIACEKADEYQFGVRVGRAIGYSECLSDYNYEKKESN